ncbi:MAG: AMP-binding protein [bacterium]|nr:AMP-binding protein [bacterium]
MTLLRNTIPTLFEAAVATHANEPFLQVRKSDDVTSYSYRDVAVEISSRAHNLILSGFQKGDRIALLGENSCEWVMTYLAIVHAGCVVVPLDAIMPLPEILHIVELSHARLLFASDKFADQCTELLEQQGRQVVVRRFEQIGANPISAKVDIDLQPSDIAAVIFTSGTTGHSKGVVLSHENLVSNVLACCKVCEIRSDDNFLLLLPLHHTFSSIVTMLLPIAKGARATLATSYRSRDVIDDIRICNVSVLVGVPQIFENMMNSVLRAVEASSLSKRALFHTLRVLSRFSKHFRLNLGETLFKSLRRKAGLSTVRLMVSGGAALPVSVNRFFESLGFVLIQGYGLTECSPVLCVNPPAKNKLGSVGPPLSGITLKIKNPNSDGVGEVCASGPNIMQGYFENEIATHSVLHDGWLNTGDAGYLDHDGYLHLTGRLKNVFVTSAGKNVYPEEIESKLAAEEAITEALVIGVARKGTKSERLCALLKLDEEYMKLHAAHKSPDQIASEVIRHYNHSTPSYQNIREWKLLEGEFEKTSTRKIKRFLYHDYFQ